MKIKCDISGITPEQTLVCLAIEGIYAKQNMTTICHMLSLNPMAFTMKNNLTEQQKQRLFADAVQHAAHGYRGEIINDQLVVSPTEAAKPSKPKRKGSSKSDSSLPEG